MSLSEQASVGMDVVSNYRIAKFSQLCVTQLSFFRKLIFLGRDSELFHPCSSCLLSLKHIDTFMLTETPKIPVMMPRKPRTADAEWKKQRNIQSEMSLLSCSFKTGSIIFLWHSSSFKVCLTILPLQEKLRG